jgi:hypothetical protein
MEVTQPPPKDKNQANYGDAKTAIVGSFLPPQTNFALNLAASYQAFPLLALGVRPAAQLVTCTFLVALVDFAQQRGGLEVASADVIPNEYRAPRIVSGIGFWMYGLIWRATVFRSLLRSARHSASVYFLPSMMSLPVWP